MIETGRMLIVFPNLRRHGLIFLRLLTGGTASADLPAENISCTAFYSIAGGRCDGLGGADAPCKLIKRHHGHHRYRHHLERESGG